MDEVTGAAAVLRAAFEDQKGPRDDFYCWTYRIWYPAEDCVYRHSNRTYSACAGCFQGRMNLRHIEKGLKVPVVLANAGRAGP